MIRYIYVLIGTCFLLIAKSQTDSTAIKNKQLIEDLKYRLNTIDNIGKSKTTTELELETLKLLVKQQNDSIVKLNALLNNHAISGNSTVAMLNNIKYGCNCEVLLYNPYQVELRYERIINWDSIISLSQHKTIYIVGHADKSGKESKNQALSRSRAEKVKNYLVKFKNISPEKIKLKWFGSSMPIANLNECHKDINRRVEIKIE